MHFRSARYKWTLVPGTVTDDDKIVYGGMMEKEELEEAKRAEKEAKRKKKHKKDEEEVPAIDNKMAHIREMEMIKDKASDYVFSNFYSNFG